MTSPSVVRPRTPADQSVVEALLTRAWGTTIVVGHGTIFDAATLPGLLAERDAEPVGLLTYQLTEDGLEVVTIDAIPPNSGAGTALLAAARSVARAAGLHRLWLVTTNDNLDALRFYQRRGLRIVRVSPGAVDVARELKPTIPAVGAYGIPMHDELTLELTW